MRRLGLCKWRLLPKNSSNIFKTDFIAGIKFQIVKIEAQTLPQGKQALAMPRGKAARIPGHMEQSPRKCPPSLTPCQRKRGQHESPSLGHAPKGRMPGPGQHIEACLRGKPHPDYRHPGHIGQQKPLRERSGQGR